MTPLLSEGSLVALLFGALGLALAGGVCFTIIFHKDPKKLIEVKNPVACCGVLYSRCGDHARGRGCGSLSQCRSSSVVRGDDTTGTCIWRQSPLRADPT